MSSAAHSAAPVAGPPVTTLTTPSGSPASVARAARTRGETGANSEGLITHVLPAASAAANFLTKIRTGWFQGVNNATGPRELVVSHRNIATFDDIRFSL